jgi:hypothetical protein
MNRTKDKICPLCHRTYSEAPALSRTDNKTLICSECGTRQALQSVGLPIEEQEQTIKAIYDKQG